MKTEVIFSRKTDEWETPQEFFEKLDSEFNFEIDVCATSENSKCSSFIGKDDDGLSLEWQGHRCWMNPPYSQVAKWMKKAHEESQKGSTVVCLVPARTDTKWFHDFVIGKAEVRFIKGRLRFGSSQYNATFPNMLVIYRPGN